MMQLRDILFCAPLKDELTTAKTACGRITRSNCHDTHVRARDAQQNRSGRTLRFHILILLSCCLPFVFCGRINGATGSSQSAITSPAPGSVLPGSSVTFSWSATSGVTQYQLQVGTTLNSNNLNPGSCAGTATSCTVRNLPINGSKIYVELGWVVSGKWSVASYTYTAASSSSLTSTTLSALTCVSGSMNGAGTDSCTVTLSAAAPSGGFAVTLASNNSAVTVPASVTVAAGATTASFTATVSAVSSAQTATLTASAGGVAETFSLQLGTSVPVLSALTCVSGSMTGAGTDNCTVTLNAAAPSGGFAVSLASNNSAVTVPASVTVAAGSKTGSFTATVSAVGSAQTVTLTASANSVAKTFSLQLSASGPVLSALTCASGSMAGAGTDSCTVTLNAAAPTGGFAISLASNNSVVAVPASVTVAAGSKTGNFTATVSAVSSAQTVTLTASANSVTKAFSLQLGTSVPVLNALTCASGSMTGAGTDSCTVTLNAAAPSGGFAVSLASNNTAVAVPASMTMAAGSTTGSFTATVSAVSSAQTVTLTASANSVTKTFSLQLGTSVPVLSALTCVSGSMTGAGTDSCTVTLNAAAPSGGFAVSLASNNTAAAVPGSATVAAGSTTASFIATISSVSTAQTVTLTASANSVVKTFALQLNTAVATLSVNATSIAFGNVNLNTAATQSVTLSSTGTAAVTVSSAVVTGSGFTVFAGAFPINLSPNQTATISAQFDPTAAGAAAGQLTITSNSSKGSSTVVSLSGTGVSATYQVDLNWDSPTSSPDPVAGYNVYRSPSGASSYQQLNTAAVTQTTYVDTGVQSGQTYNYIVESVDASGVTSSPSNMAAVPVP